MEDIDTDTSLAILSSLLEPASFPLDQLLDALTEAQGEISIAAEALLLPRVKSAGKRKAGTSIESWLSRKKLSPSTPPKAASVQDEKPKPSVDLLSVLQQPDSSKPRNPPRPPILLSNQTNIDKHGLPLTIVPTPLPPAFASALYLTMMNESEKWPKYKWYLAGKLVEAPHAASGYKRTDGGHGDPDDISRYFYSGMELKTPNTYPDILAEASELVEKAVNVSLDQRKRSPWEYAGPWRANVCGVNRYDGSASGVGWHADQLSYLGPHATIASLSLGTPRAFRLRPTDTVDSAFSNGKPTRTYEITLGHNTLVLMNAGCQERFKHTIPPQKALDLFRPGWDVDQEPMFPTQQRTYTSRINITFRFYREDFHPLPKAVPHPRDGTPVCKCGMPCLLRADQKAKVRTKLPPSPSNGATVKVGVLEDDMVWFWQCQSPGQTGEMKGCGFFKILDMKGEGRGPCIGDN